MACSGGEACRTCDGRCCSLFTYTVPLEQIADRYAAGEGAAGDLQLLELLYPLTPEEARERALRFKVEGLFGSGIAKDQPPENGYYSCRAWDEETRLCTIYDTRPQMCRGYPYGRGCQHGCSYEVGEDTLLETGYLKPKDWFEKSYV